MCKLFNLHLAWLRSVALLPLDLQSQKIISQWFSGLVLGLTIMEWVFRCMSHASDLGKPTFQVKMNIEYASERDCMHVSYQDLNIE